MLRQTRMAAMTDCIAASLSGGQSPVWAGRTDLLLLPSPFRCFEHISLSFDQREPDPYFCILAVSSAFEAT